MNTNHPPCKVTTRMAPLALSASHAIWAATFLAGSCFSGGRALAVDNLWLGTTPDWNTLTNWSLGRVPVNPNGQPVPNEYDDAVVNAKTPFPALISANPSATPRDILVGVAGGANGQLDHTAGAASTGSSNWMNVGANTGTGVYNLANTAVSGAGFSTYAEGSGSMVVAGRFQVGQAGSNGTVNINTSGFLTVNGGGGDAFKIGEGTGGVGRLNIDGGTVNIPNGEVWIGQGAGSTGTMQMSGGTVNAGSWFAIGRGSGNGTLNLSGGTINKTGGGDFMVGDGAVGLLTQSGGTINVNNTFRVGNGGNGIMNQSGGTVAVGNEFWVGQGANATDSVYNLSAGTLTVNNWVAIGRDSGKGTVNMTGGTIIKAGNAVARFIVGASGTGGGTMNQSGGLTDVQTGITWIGENNTTGTLNLSGTAEFRTSEMRLGEQASATGNVNLNGGTLRAGHLNGGPGTANVNFNGTQLIATSNQTAYIANLDVANVAAGGLKVDTNSFSVGVGQVLTGTGAITKSGAGTMTLTGANSYSGGTTVTGGTLLINGSQTLATGLVSVANGAVLGGSGTSGGSLSIGAGGTLAPGNSPGTLTSTGSAAFDANALLAYEFLGTDQTVGGGINDLLTGVTNLTLDGTLNVVETTTGSFLSATLGNSWRIVNYTGSLTNNGLALGSTPALTSGLAFAVDTSTTGQVNLVVVPVPEPTTTAVLGAALAAMGLRRRRR